MKKFLLSRLLVIAIFCLVSISIKSEATVCKVISRCTVPEGAAALEKVAKADTPVDYFRPDVFYIKI